jgi:hypothetical protein
MKTLKKHVTAFKATCPKKLKPICRVHYTT